MSSYKIGIIGGSGLYHIEGFTNQKWVKVTTPFGAPSDDFLTGKLGGRDVVFLPRHHSMPRNTSSGSAGTRSRS